jgi:hypothetical protein
MAIKALAWMVRTFEPPVYCYHEIVHNKIVVQRFEAQGVVFVDDIDEVAQREAYTINITMNAGGSGTFVVGESVYQGNTSLATATASAEVYEWTASTRVLAVQRVVGTFAGSTAVKGNTSGAQWTSVAAAAATAPTLHDPLSDNAFLQGNPLSVVKSRGTHMLED